MGAALPGGHGYGRRCNERLSFGPFRSGSEGISQDLRYEFYDIHRHRCWRSRPCLDVASVAPGREWIFDARNGAVRCSYDDGLKGASICGVYGNCLIRVRPSWGSSRSCSHWLSSSTSCCSARVVSIGWKALGRDLLPPIGRRYPPSSIKQPPFGWARDASPGPSGF